ncbi:unnamed protein product [Moneuplotes crassus]|uniref:EF-hand domain-containing protein n=1 Tax=Euplotes crassus TaxID=5936 RepID=A0AAD1Y8E4_EUPCR|nr:unnamed protein product [Moneuplotes crassus]
MPSKKEALLAVISDEAKFIATAEKAFKSVDVDGSGKLDPSELKSCLATFNADFDAPPPSDERVQEYIALLDTDEVDGLISFEEFQILLKAMMTVTLEMLE